MCYYIQPYVSFVALLVVLAVVLLVTKRRVGENN